MPRKHSSDEPARRGAEGRGGASPRPSLAARPDWEAACRETPRRTPRPPPWPPRLFPLPAKAVIVTELSAVGSEGPCLGPRTTQGTSCLRGGTCSGHALGGSRGGRVAGGPVARPSVHVRPASPAGHRPATPPPGTHSVSRLSRPSRLWVPRRWMRLLWRCLCGEKGHVRLGAHSPGQGRGRAAAGAGRWRQKHRRMAPALGPSVSSDTAIGPAAEVTRSGAGPTAGCAGLNSDGGERNSPAAADRLPPPSDRGLQSAGAGGGSGRGSLCGLGPGTQPAGCGGQTHLQEPTANNQPLQTAHN